MKLKSITLALALLASFAVQAQTTASGASDAAAVARGGDVSVTLPQANPYSFVSSLQDARLHSNQAAPAQSSFATQAVWRCATAGAGGAVQFVGFGATGALPGGEAVICGVDFRIAVHKAIAAMPDDEQKIALRIACTDDVMADAYEGTKFQCGAPQPNARKARWDRERNGGLRARAMLEGRDTAVATQRQPMPWMAGG